MFALAVSSRRRQTRDGAPGRAHGVPSVVATWAFGYVFTAIGIAVAAPVLLGCATQKRTGRGPDRATDERSFELASTTCRDRADSRAAGTTKHSTCRFGLRAGGEGKKNGDCQNRFFHLVILRRLGTRPAFNRRTGSLVPMDERGRAGACGKLLS